MRWMVLLCFAISGAACAAEPVTRHGIEATGRLLSINGTTQVPRGLFGVHATPLSADQVKELGIESVRTIDHNPGRPKQAESSKWLPPGVTHLVECFYDRYQPALIVTRPDWRAELERVAEQYGKAARSLNRPAIVEFWNEPYLNWGVRPGVNYDGQFYKPQGREIGAAMTLKHADQPTEHLVWTRQLVAVPAEGDRTHYLATRYKPNDKKEGETFIWRGNAYRLEMRWWGRDVTQETFWPGKQNSMWYRQMLVPFAKKLKATNPDVTLVAGWGFHIHQNGWAAWEDVHRPTIDAAIQWIDGYNEHHYGGDTRMVAGAYETVTAYTVGKYGKALAFYNTEAGGELDPEQPGAAQPGYNTLQPDVRQRGAMTYMLRDIIHLIDVCPDKAAARAAHEAGGKGHRAALKLLKPLRGRLVEVRTGSPNLWAVGAVDGQRMCIVIFNDTLEPVTETMRVHAPADTRFKGGVQRSINDELDIVESAVDALGKRYAAEVAVAGRSAVALVFDIEGSIGEAAATRYIEQHHCPNILTHIAPGQSAEFIVELPGGVSTNDLQGATLRMVQHNFDHDAKVTLNGTAVKFSPVGPWVHDEAVASSLIAQHNVIRISNPTSAAHAIDVNALSLLLVRGRP